MLQTKTPTTGKKRVRFDHLSSPPSKNNDDNDNEFDGFILENPQRLVEDLKAVHEEQRKKNDDDDDDDDGSHHRRVAAMWSQMRLTRAERVIQEWVGTPECPRDPPPLATRYDNNERSLLDSARAFALKMAKRHVHLTTTAPPPPSFIPRRRGSDQLFISFAAITNASFSAECHGMEECENVCALMLRSRKEQVVASAAPLVQDWVDTLDRCTSGVRELVLERCPPPAESVLKMVVQIGVHQVYFGSVVFFLPGNVCDQCGDNAHFLLERHVNEFGYQNEGPVLLHDKATISAHANANRRRDVLLGSPCTRDNLQGVQFYTCDCDFFK